MYFIVSIFAPLRLCKWYLFNELSDLTSRWSLYVATSCCAPAVLMFRPCLAFRCFNLFVFAIKLRLVALVSFGTAKVGNFFSSANKKWNIFYLLFFIFISPSFPFSKPRPLPPKRSAKVEKLFHPPRKKIKLFSLPFVVAFHLVPSSSEAECKGRKKYTLRNIYRVFYSTVPHNQLEYNKKKSQRPAGSWKTRII